MRDVGGLGVGNVERNIVLHITNLQAVKSYLRQKIIMMRTVVHGKKDLRRRTIVLAVIVGIVVNGGRRSPN
jgi:hypothetical protein